MKSKAYKELVQILTSLKNEKELEAFLTDLLTPRELEQVVERWQIVKRLHAGESQRSIAKALGTGIMTVTRGSAALKRGSGGFDLVLERLMKET